MDPIEWHPQPRRWLDQLLAHVDSVYESHPSDRRRWLAVQHQVLTLAKTKNSSSLWFTLGRNLNHSPQRPFQIWGVALPERRIVLSCPELDFHSPSLSHETIDETICEFLVQRFEPKILIASPPLAEKLNFNLEVMGRQTAWWRNPHSRWESRQQQLSMRRAIESDRKLVASWGDVFSAETQTSARQESLEWLNRGRLVLFEKIHESNATPVGMAAFSGEFSDRDFGRLARISLVFVDPGNRGRGLGTEILHQMALDAQIDGIAAVVLFSDSSQPKAHRFYSEAGFLPLGEIAEFKVKTTG